MRKGGASPVVHLIKEERMKSVMKSSKKAGAQEAVSEAVSGIEKPLGIIFMCDYSRLAEISELLKKQFPNTPIIGTAGIAYHGTTIGDRNLLIVTAITGEAQVAAGIIRNLKTDPLSDMWKLADSVKKVSPKKDDTVCLEFCTVNEEALVSSMNVVLAPKGVALAGGTVYGAPEGKPSLVAYEGKVYENACAYMVVRNANGKAYVLRENIYDKADGPAHIATKVNPEKREVVELDHRPAAVVYAEETGVDKNRIVENVLQEPFGRIINQDIYIASMNGISSNGAISNYKRINQNDALYILKLLDYRQINTDTRNKIKELVPKPSMIFAINCIYRYMLFDKENYLQEFLKNMSDVAPFAGYIGGGEQYNRQHVNQTMVCAIFS